MFLRRFTQLVLQNRLLAMGIAFVLTFIPWLGTISVLIAGLVTLRKGAVEGGLVFIAATAPYLFYFTHLADLEQTTIIFLCVVLASNLLTWIFAVLLREYSNWNFVLELTIFIGIVFISGVHIFNPDIQVWWQAEIMAYFKAFSVKDLFGGTGISPKDMQTQMAAFANHYAVYATGFAAAGVFFNSLLQLLLARWWQAAMFNPGGLRKELHQIRLSHIAGIVFIIGVIFSYFGNKLSLDIIPVMYMIFCAAGLSLLHCVVVVTNMAWLLLAFVYLGLILVPQLGFMVVAFVGLLDTWLDFRKRLVNKR